MLIYALILIIVTWLGGYCARRMKIATQKSMSYVLLMVAGYMLSTTLTHLLAEAYADTSRNKISSLLLLCGVLAQHFMGQLSLGAEHGHASKKTLSLLRAWQLVIALCIHSLLEGFIGLHALSHSQALSPMLLGIILHKFPAAFALAIILSISRFSVLEQRLAMAFFIFSTPFGLLFGEHVLFNLDNFVAGNYIFPFVAGMFLHIAMSMVLEAAPQHIYGYKKNVMILIGVLVGLLAMHGHDVLN